MNMIKKTYNQPICFVVQLRGRDALLSSVSAFESTGMRYGGTTSGNDVTDADVKVTNDVNLWDNEW